MLVFLALCLAACGGGGGGGSSDSGSEPQGTLPVSPTSLFFSSASGSVAQTVTISNLAGPTAQAGFAAGVTQPGWLHIASGTSTTFGTAAFSVFVSRDGFSPGTYTSRIRFLDPLSQAYYDVPVSYVILPLGVSSTSFSTTLISDNYVDNSQTFSLYADSGRAWTISSDQSWVSPSQTSGSGAATITLNINPASLNVGIHTATLHVHDTASGYDIPQSVSITVIAPQLTLSPTALTLNVSDLSNAAQLSTTFTIAMAPGSSPIDWGASSPSPWVTLTPATGNSATSTTVTVSVDPQQIAAFANGTYTTKIYAANSNKPMTLTLNLTLGTRILTVSPYVVNASGNYYVTLHGSGFSTLNPAATAILFGNTPVYNYQVISDSRIRVRVPALTGGLTIPVQLANIAQPGPVPVVVVQSPAALPYTFYPVASTVRRLVYDNERQTLYAVDPINKHINVLYYDASGWHLSSLGATEPNSVGAPVQAPIVDAALSTDGKYLVMIGADHSVFQLNLSVPSQIQQTVYGDGSTNNPFQDIVFGWDNQALITSAGGNVLHVYDPNSWSLTTTSSGSLGAPRAFASADGTRILLADSNALYQGVPLTILKTGTGTLSGVSIDRGGDTWALHGNNLGSADIVYKNNVAIGTIGPTSNSNPATLISADGSTAYALDTTLGYSVLDFYNLSSANSASLAPLAQTGGMSLNVYIDTPYPGYAGPQFLLSSDNKTLFYWGGNGVNVFQMP